MVRQKIRLKTDLHIERVRHDSAIDRNVFLCRKSLIMPIRILIVDDHAVVRQGLRMFLGLDPELEIIGEAMDGKQAIETAHRLQPDVVLMDLLMPIMDGVTAIGIIRRELPDTEVIALTSVLEDQAVIGAIRAGAIGYLLKDTESDELIRAIKAAANGQVQLSPKAAARLLREVRAPESPEALTEREVEVLRLLAKGFSNKEIAQDLVIGEKTVKTHVSNILSKLNLTSRTQAALHAARIGLVELEG
jgi:two-component system, NarL family, response regulator LiaR